MKDKKTKIRIGERTITTSNVPTDFQRQFESLRNRHFDSLQDFIIALSQTDQQI